MLECVLMFGLIGSLATVAFLFWRLDDKLFRELMLPHSDHTRRHGAAGDPQTGRIWRPSETPARVRSPMFKRPIWQDWRK
jgi:hypothetical protein